MAELVKGSSPRGSADDVLVFDLLFEWLQDGKKMRLSEVVCWNELIDALDDNSQRRFEKLAGIEITSPVMHGDFAPWNIKIFKNGSVKVLDWEYAAHHGIPGWDALHYVVQRKSLVGGGAAAAILDECRVFLRSDKMKTYLERAGLENEPEALLGSYLFYSGEVQGYPRADLISQWVATQ